MINGRRFSSLFFVSLVLARCAFGQSPRVMDSGELAIALKKLTVLGSALLIAAHPDDENTAALAYLAKGRCVRTAYLAITRGEGGQNLIGSEQGELMGIIRTHELLAARGIDGAEQYFTSAIDFGYSKNSEETLRIWGHESTLADVVWIIRKLRPDVVISRFTPTQGGHGNHTSSAILAEEAFRAAGDPSRFPEQLKFVKPWKPKRLGWNVFRFQSGDASSPPNSVAFDVGTYSPLLGKSFTEIAGLSRSMHKSQGFGAAENRGTLPNYFQHTAGDTARQDLFDGVDLSWNRVQGGETVGMTLAEAYHSFDPKDPSALLPILLRAYGQLANLKDHYWVGVKRKELLEVIKSCAGLWVDALAADYSASPGGEVRVSVTHLNRSTFPFVVERVSLFAGRNDSLLNAPLLANKSVQAGFSFRIPSDAPLTQPYWLRESAEIGSYRIKDQSLVGTPENAPAFSANVVLIADKERLELDVPLRYRWVDPVEGEQYRPFEVVPAVALNLQEPVLVFPNLHPKKVEVELRSGTPQVAGTVRLKTPKGWSVQPAEIPFTMKEKNEAKVFAFQVKPTNGATTGMFSAEAEVGGKILAQGIRTIQYKHIPPQTLFPKSEGKLVRVDLHKDGQNLGYIMGAGDEIPAALRQVGYSVSLLTDEELAEGELSRFDAIIAGVRAYNTRPKLRMNQKRLMEYVERGGTYVVQYNTLQRGQTHDVGPFPLNISNARVTVEEAPVSFLMPTHSLLNVPNKITAEDFKGWIQERGLYFADKWDSKYEAVIASNDPGEKPLEGGLLVASHGKGRFVFSAYAFFRQLPAGVGGAYRLFVNLVSIGK